MVHFVDTRIGPHKNFLKGNYNSRPSDTGFFSDNGFDNYASAYGRFFLGKPSNLVFPLPP